MSLKGGTGIKVHQVVSLVRNFLQKKKIFNFVSASHECVHVHGIQKSFKLLNLFVLDIVQERKRVYPPRCQISEVND